MHRATRGVCIGVDRHLQAGDPVPPDLTAAEVQFLASIGAVEKVPDAPVQAELAEVVASSDAPPPADAQPTPDPETPTPAKPGKKEK